MALWLKQATSNTGETCCCREGSKPTGGRYNVL